MRSDDQWGNFQRGHVSGLWDWSPFNNCFNRGVRFSDIDGIVDDNGRFLIFEGKRIGSEFKKGQRLLFRNLSLLPNFTIVIVTGYPPKTVKYWHTYSGEIEGHDIESLKRFTNNWWNSEGDNE